MISLFFLFQVGTPLEEDLSNWGHHFFPTSVPDAILQASAGEEVWEEKILYSSSVQLISFVGLVHGNSFTFHIGFTTPDKLLIFGKC